MKTTPLISIKKMGFAYWDVDAPADHSQRTREDLNIVFEKFSLDLPAGVTSVLGENGIGKSTLLLLAGARLFPASGQVSIGSTDSARWLEAHLHPELEEERNRLVSFVYQNMEFETEAPLGELIEALLAQSTAAGNHGGASGLDLAGLSTALELTDILGKKPQALAKGELQRGIIALAVAYGSKILIMDEPVFALEERHKQLAFGFLREWCGHSGTSLIYTAHDIHLCRDFATTMLLLFKDKSYKLGSVAEVCTNANLEAAYKVPLDTLYQKENLYRSMLRDKSMEA